MLILTSLYILLTRVMRPFVNEIIFLERNPIRSQQTGTITIGRRSSSLHTPSSADMIGRFVMVSVGSIVLVLGVILTVWFGQALATNDWTISQVMVKFFVPLAAWLVAVQATVVRFLGYLDLRIRREGWEVELKVRAAAAELKEQVA